MKEEDLLSTAHTVQNIHHKVCGDYTHDVLPKNSLNKFVEILIMYLEEEKAKPLAGKVIQNRADLYYKILTVQCIADKKLMYTIVIKVLEGSCDVFYDEIGRKYCDWNAYLCNNKLPKGLMVYPKNGTYTIENGKVQVETKKSPAGGLLSQMDKALIITAEVVSLAALMLPLFSFAKPYASEITIASGVSNGYKVAHHSYRIYDRYKHDQSIALSDEDAFFHFSHIGNASLCFAFTYQRSFYGNPSPDSDFMNFGNIIQTIVRGWNQDKERSLKIIQGQLLSGYMLDFSNEMVQKLSKVCKTGLKLDFVLQSMRQYSEKYESKFRKLVFVDDFVLTKVLQDIEISNNLKGGIQSGFYGLAEEMENMYISKIVKEARSWQLKNISTNQLQFRVSSICEKGHKEYETIEELLKYYNENNLEDIFIDNKPIFKDVRGKMAEVLEELVCYASKDYPQLLSHFVKYASKNNPVNWDNWKAYFIEKLYEDSAKKSFMGSRHCLSWVNIITSKVIGHCDSDDGIYLVRPKENSVCPQDLINLCKKFLNILKFSDGDILIAKPEIMWTVLVSQRKGKIVCIGPKISENESVLNGTYTVFVKHLS